MVNHAQPISNFDNLQDQYELFLFDQFGVLHDGVKAYAGMQSMIAKLKHQGKRIAVISNSGKRASVNADRIRKMGFGDELIDQVYTSGEVAWLRFKSLVLGQRNGSLKLFFLGNGNDRSAFAGLPMEEAELPELADIIVIAGMGPVQRTNEEYEKLLRKAASIDVNAFCTNPDNVSLVGDGSVTMGPGGIASIYRNLGGSCEYVGKPFPEIYTHILKDSGIPAHKVVCIGDSVEHDIVGASRAGCHSVLVRTGIHEQLTDSELDNLFDQSGVRPNYILENR
ncbi:MAG: HAD superfamily hydrolase (TIGR01459 family) [Granulosicoccus sp.]